MTIQLKATPSFIIELMNASRGLNEIEANRLMGRLNLDNSSILTYENVRRAQDEEEKTENIRPPLPSISPSAKTQVSDPPVKLPDTKVVKPVTTEPSEIDYDEALTSSELAYWIQFLISSDSEITIWAKEVFPIMNILKKEIASGKTVTINDVKNILIYYSKGNEPDFNPEDFLFSVEPKEKERMTEEQMSEERVFGRTPGQRSEEAIPSDSVVSPELLKGLSSLTELPLTINSLII